MYSVVGQLMESQQEIGMQAPDCAQLTLAYRLAVWLVVPVTVSQGVQGQACLEGPQRVAFGYVEFEILAVYFLLL